jgi:hypothetical protein
VRWSKICLPLHEYWKEWIIEFVLDIDVYHYFQQLYSYRLPAYSQILLARIYEPLVNTVISWIRLADLNPCTTCTMYISLIIFLFRSGIAFYFHLFSTDQVRRKAQTAMIQQVKYLAMGKWLDTLTSCCKPMLVVFFSFWLEVNDHNHLTTHSPKAYVKIL